MNNSLQDILLKMPLRDEEILAYCAEKRLLTKPIDMLKPNEAKLVKRVMELTIC